MEVVMDYEKKYKEALAKAEGIIVYYKEHNRNEAAIEDLETIFPELAESEDEKVRKAIIELLNTTIKGKKVYSIADTTRSEMIAWLENIPYTIDHEKREGFRLGYKAGLEKQGEQKHVDKVVPKFHKGDWIVWQDKCYKVNYNGCGYELIDQNGLSTSLEYGTVDKSAHLWTIKDAKDGDVLYYKGENGIEYIVMSKGINRCGNIDSYFRYNSNCGFGVDVPSVLSAKNNDITPATKEQRDLLFQKMKEAGYEWDAEKKELKNIHVIDEGKAEMDYCFTKMMNGEKVSSTWSEEDEEMFNTALDMIEWYSGKNENKSRAVSDWFKSLKNRVLPQPKQEWSEEDEVRLQACLDTLQAKSLMGKVDTVMTEWLKSLKERVQPIHEYSDTEKQEIFIKSQRPHFWRPSDEQMHAFEQVYDWYNNNYIPSETFTSLYNDLKKLREK